MILFLCRLWAANSARLFDTLRGSCREAGPFLCAAKSAFKDGKADCHDQFANWSRNDREFYKGRGGMSGGRTESFAPTDDKEICASPGAGRCGHRPLRDVT